MIKKYITRFRRWMGYNPPGSLSSKGWRLFRKEYKEKAPIRFYISNTFRRKFIYPIKWKWDHATNWIRYRTYDKYHVVKTGLEPQYYDKDTLMLHMNFNLLKDFVEEELAWRSWCWADDTRPPLSFARKYIPFARHSMKFQYPELGMKHLEWEATLDDPALPPHEQSPEQAASAREKIVLYKWWMQVRPARAEIETGTYSDQGLDDLSSLDEDFDRDSPDFKVFREKMDQRAVQEEEWDKEDEEMLVRLVRLRGSLWT